MNSTKGAVASNFAVALQGVNAPLLKGEGNWEKIGLHAGPEARALSCCDALLAHIPFWLKVRLASLRSTLSVSCRMAPQPLRHMLPYMSLILDETSRAPMCHASLLQGPEWLRRHAELLEELAGARGAADLAPDVAEAEAVLLEQGVLAPEWAARWRDRWRASLAAAPTAHTVLLHVAALQACAAHTNQS